MTWTTLLRLNSFFCLAVYQFYSLQIHVTQNIITFSCYQSLVPSPFPKWLDTFSPHLLMPSHLIHNPASYPTHDVDLLSEFFEGLNLNILTELNCIQLLKVNIFLHEIYINLPLQQSYSSLQSLLDPDTPCMSPSNLLWWIPGLWQNSMKLRISFDHDDLSFLIPPFLQWPCFRSPQHNPKTLHQELSK